MRDFTVNAYTKHSSLPISEKSTSVNVQTNYDGNYPSAFTCSNYYGMGSCPDGKNNCPSFVKN